MPIIKDLNRSPHYLVVDLSKEESDLLVGFARYVENEQQPSNVPGYRAYCNTLISIAGKIETAKIAASSRVKR
jgi:hypothetical protein